MDIEEQPQPLELLAAQECYPVALLRLAIDCGCPAQRGLLKLDDFLRWISENYAVLRAQAGLPELVSDEGLTEKAASRVRIANGLSTIMDYIESRASEPSTKQSAASASAFLQSILDDKFGEEL